MLDGTWFLFEISSVTMVGWWLKPVGIPTEVNNFLLNQHAWIPCQIIKVWDHRGSHRSMSIAPIFKLVWNDWKLVTSLTSWSRTAYDLSSSVQFSLPYISFADSNIHSSCHDLVCAQWFHSYTSLQFNLIERKCVCLLSTLHLRLFKIKDIRTNSLLEEHTCSLVLPTVNAK